VRQAVQAGAVGVSTSRVSVHRGKNGDVVPGTHASEEELIVVGKAMGEAGGGVFQIIPSGIAGGVEGAERENVMAGLAAKRDPYYLTEEIDRMRRIHKATGQPITFTFSENRGLGPEEYWRARERIGELIAAGDKIYPQYAPRQVNSLTNLDTYHAFTARPSYRVIAQLPVAERARRMADPAVKAAILSEADVAADSSDPMQHIHVTLARNVLDTYELGADLDFEPHPSRSIAARAKAEGRDPMDLIYDLLIADEGRKVLVFFASNYLDGDLNKLADLIRDPHFVMGLSDAGAHVCFICGGAQASFTLSHWGKNRIRGERLPVELLVRRLTSDAAALYRLDDRGVIAPGKKADLNVIDFEHLRVKPFRLAHDLPTGAKRFLQDAEGYALTVVNGVVTRRDDQDTGARPGRLIRRRHETAAAAAV
jgi:N-acyl-D-amino-acid deacylase